MLNKFVIFASLFVSTFSFAQGMSIEMDANRLAQEINQNGRYLGPEQRAQISQQIQAIRAVIYGAQQQQSVEYTCVSKDNDGRNPYVLGLRSGINVIRYAGSTFPTINDCQANIQSIRNIGNYAVTCFSKDADGRNPWMMTLLDGAGNATKVAGSVVGTYQECASLVQGLVVRNDIANYCSSKDNDGRAPYVASSLNFRNGSVQVGTNAFSTITDCYSFLGLR